MKNDGQVDVGRVLFVWKERKARKLFLGGDNSAQMNLKGNFSIHVISSSNKVSIIIALKGYDLSQGQLNSFSLIVHDFKLVISP